MKRIFQFFGSLLLVFLLGFFLAGGRDVMHTETLTRIYDYMTSKPSAETSRKKMPADDPFPGVTMPEREPQGRQNEQADALTRIQRFIFLQDAVNARVSARNFIPVSDLPNRLTQAIVAVEDSRFYSHHGFDVEAILRALLVNAQAGEIEEGASTITQQLVKNLFLTPEQTMERKIEELALALNMEARYSKQEILSLYLNSIYFGSGYYGIYDAARGYFGKSPQELSLPECAMLAGLPNAPSVYSPYEDFLMAKRRQFVVLDAMVRAGYIDERTATDAKIEPLFLAH